jgi:hypothetical protein
LVSHISHFYLHLAVTALYRSLRVVQWLWTWRFAVDLALLPVTAAALAALANHLATRNICL